MFYKIRFIMALCLLMMSGFAKADITVLAAASLTNALSDIIKIYQEKTGIKIKSSFASSSVLAKQIENGIDANIFISADSQWMDYVYDKGKIDNTTRHNLLSNDLVLIAPKGQSFKTNLIKGSNLANAFEGKLCTGETETVPVGKYAKEALEKLDLWNSMKARIVGTEDVRSALAFVERGECTAGIVYKTDALNNNKVEIIATFPEDSHAAIIYPVALVNQSNEAYDFLNYLSQKQAFSVFTQYGFKAVK